MNRAQVAQVVTRIYTAAGRRAAETDFATWAEMLDDIACDDREALEAVTTFVRNTAPGELVNIARFRDVLNNVVRRRNERLATERGLRESSATSPDEAKANLARLRAMMRCAVKEPSDA